MEVKFKKLHLDAVIPSYSTHGDAGMDIKAVSGAIYSCLNDFVEYKTGLAVEIPEGYVGLIYPRSSISKYTVLLTNSVGVIDAGFRGEICFRFMKYGSKVYCKGDRIGQIIIMPCLKIIPVEATELSETIRGTGAYGSSGK